MTIIMIEITGNDIKDVRRNWHGTSSKLSHRTFLCESCASPSFWHSPLVVPPILPSLLVAASTMKQTNKIRIVLA